MFSCFLMQVKLALNPSLSLPCTVMAIATPTEYGGYEYTFVDPPPHRCICNICHHPSRGPYMTGECCRGQTICKSCLDQWREIKGATRCPVCNKEGNFNAYPNYHIEREIKSSNVYCTNKGRGCEWEGELNDINNHLESGKGCQFEEVKCSKECGKMIERRYLTSHVETECPHRKVNCQYCHDTGEHQFIEGQHKEECPKFPLPCPNKCEVGSVPREDMKAHRKECPLEMIQCEYHNVGCEVKMARKDREKHENEKIQGHLVMTKGKLDNTQHELADTKTQLATALRQIINLTMLMNAQLNPNYTHDNIKSVYLDSMVMISEFADQSCPVIIKMTEYTIKKRDELQWYSNSFYTHNKGYKMCLNIDAGGYGDGEGTHLSVFLYLMKGSHDDELTWPLKGKFEIKLLNQVTGRAQNHCCQAFDYYKANDAAQRVTDDEVDKDKIGLGTSQFISNDNLYKANSSCQYLKDDCLFFQITKL